MRQRCRAGLVVLAVAAVPGTAAAQDKPAEGGVRLAPSTKPVGEYSGIEPGEGAPPGVKARRGKFPLVTWVGFQPQEGGGARVFIQLDREFTHATDVKNGAIHVVLAGARYANRNARRQLDTRFFQTGIERITTQPARRRRGKGAKSGVEVTIRFKNPADAGGSPTTMAGKDGMQYLVFDFGPMASGSAPPPATPAPPSEPE